METDQSPHAFRNKRQTKTTAKPKTGGSENILSGLIADVGRLFRVIDYLDENECLQKFVCSVHSNAKSIVFQKKEADTFETNVKSAFKLVSKKNRSNE